MSKKPQTFSSMFKNPKSKIQDDDTLPLDSDHSLLDDYTDNGKTIIVMKGFEQAAIDPTVGWLVVVSGEGKGKSIPIIAGINSVGRGSKNKIILNFNDNRISSHKHCCIIYDPKNHDYFLKHEDGKNLSYLNDKAVLTVEKLTNYNKIQLGDTKLLFIALCGELFEWE